MLMVGTPRQLFDCGYETTGLAATATSRTTRSTTIGRLRLCSYWSTSWLGNSVIDNLASYSGGLFVLDGGSELASGQTTNYFYDNNFEGNVLSHGAWDLFGRSAELSSWAGDAIPLTVGGNSFVDNDFGDTTPSPFIEPTQPPLVGEESGNECQLPSTYLECAAPGEPSPQPPRVAGVYPAQGPEGGRVPVVIEGSGFTGADEVHFGAQTARITSVPADSRLVVEAPPGAPVRRT